MFDRVLTAVLVCSALFLATPACTVRRVNRIDAAALQKAPTDKIVGITTTSGDDVSFDTGASTNDKTLRATVKKAAYEIPLDQVQRYWVERRDFSTGRTVALVAVVGIAAISVAVGISNANRPKIVNNTGGCPFVYSWDGHQFVFDAELFGGAVARGLQREDYSELLHLHPYNRAYRVRVNHDL